MQKGLSTGKWRALKLNGYEIKFYSAVTDAVFLCRRCKMVRVPDRSIKIIRTRFLSEKPGSDYFALVRRKGLEPPTY